MPEANNQRAFLLEVMSRTGWSQTQLAQRASLDPSTLSRFLSAPRNGHALRETTMRKIARAANMPWADEPSANGHTGFGEAEATPFDRDTPGGLAGVLTTLAADGVNIDPWILNSTALEGAGYRRGDVLLVKLGEVPRPGDVVCAQRFDWSRNRAETLFRLYQPPYLVSASADPAFLRPFTVEDAAIAVRGVVIHSIRTRSV